jgi:hypothetical protein
MKKLLIIVALFSALVTSARQITFYGTLSTHSASGGQTTVTVCRLSPVICAVVEEPIGPLQQNGSFRATVYNADGTVHDSFEFVDYTVNTNGDGETILHFQLP